MMQCLTDDEISSYIRGTASDQQRSAVAEHLGRCVNCRTRVESAQLAGDEPSQITAQAVTRAEVTSAMEVGACSSVPASHWTDGEIEREASIQRSPSAPKVSLDDFLTGLSESGLLPASDVASVRDRSHKDPATSTVAGLIEWLVQSHKLTRYQANILARGQRGGLVLGNYVIEDKLGQGGMGAVFKARHRRMNRLVALKVLPQSLSSVPEAIARFQREVEAAARLTHPNIAAAYDADEAGGVHFLVMEYVEGPTLAHYVKQRGALPIAIAVKLVAQAARGLAAAHAQGIVHRDIKPSNIMINRQGIVKVLDMGLAQVRGPEPNLDLTSDVTQTGRVMGTVDYMAPEQARDAKNVDLRADIYSLGCTLYFLAIGKTPAPSGSPAEKLLWHQAQPPMPLSAAGITSSPKLDELVLRMMAKKPEERPNSMHDVAEELERCLDDLPAADCAMLLDGMDLVSEHGASTLYGSNYGQATMHNLGDTILTDPGRSGSQPAPAAKKSRQLAYAGGLVAVGLLMVFGIRQFMNFGQPPAPPPGETTLIVTVDGDPAEVLIDRELRGTTRGDGQPLELKVKPGSIIVQVRRQGFALYEQRVGVRAGEEPARVRATLKKIEEDPRIPTASVHAAYQPLLDWVFGMRGKVTGVTGVGQEYFLNRETPLPDQALRIQGIILDGTGVRDPDLAALKDVPGLLELSLADTRITNSALEHLAPLKDLKRLNLSQTGITNDGLESLKRLAGLVELNLEKTAINDQGILRLKGMASLEKLFLSDTRVTDTGVVHLKSLPALKLLTLHGTSLSEPVHAALEAALPELKISWDGADVERAVALRLLGKRATLAVVDRTGERQEGIASIDRLPGGRIVIKDANLSTGGPDISDDDLKQVSLLAEVESLSLGGTKVTRDGLLTLQSLSKLRVLDLGTLDLSPTAVRQLKQMLPNCAIGIREPADVDVARQVIAAGGQVTVQQTEGGKVLSDIRDAARLPANRYSIQTIKLDNCEHVNDAFLEPFGQLPHLQSLYLSNTGVTDKGLGYLAACKELKVLGLSSTKITAAGLAALAAPQLEQLYVAHTDIGGEGIRAIGNLPRLTHLSLQGLKLADGDFAPLKRLIALKWLDVSSTPLSDGALAHLSGLRGLTDLRVQGTALTDAGLEELQTELGRKCTVQGDPLDPQRLAAKWIIERSGTVSLDSGKLATAKDLPRDSCRVLAIDVAELPLSRMELAARLAACPHVVNLNLSGTRLGESDLVFLRTLPALQELRLAGLPLSDQVLMYLAGSTKLEILELTGCTQITGAGLAHLKAATGLKQLLLGNTRIDERHLVNLEPLKALEALDLTGASGVTDNGVESIAKLKGLKMLGLRSAKVTNDAAEQIAQLTELETLDLQGTKIGDEGVAKLSKLTRLHHLKLNGTEVTEGVVAILAEMQQLATINLAGIKLSASAIETLRTKLPGRTITTSSPAPADPNNPFGTGAGQPFEVLPMGPS